MFPLVWVSANGVYSSRSWSMYPPWTNPMWCTMFFLCPFSPKISALSYHCPASSRPRWFPPSPAGWTSPSSQGPHRPKKWIVATWCPTSSGRHWAGPRMMEHQPPHRGKLGKNGLFFSWRWNGVQYPMFKQMHLRQVKCRPNAARPPVIPAEAPKQTDKSKETDMKIPERKKITWIFCWRLAHLPFGNQTWQWKAPSYRTITTFGFSIVTFENSGG